MSMSSHTPKPDSRKTVVNNTASNTKKTKTQKKKRSLSVPSSSPSSSKGVGVGLGPSVSGYELERLVNDARRNGVDGLRRLMEALDLDLGKLLRSVNKHTEPTVVCDLLCCIIHWFGTHESNWTGALEWLEGVCRVLSGFSLTQCSLFSEEERQRLSTAISSLSTALRGRGGSSITEHVVDVDVDVDDAHQQSIDDRLDKINSLLGTGAVDTLRVQGHKYV
eukprot:gene10233-21339_t